MKSKSHRSAIIIAVATVLLASLLPNAFAQEATITTRCTCSGFIVAGKLVALPAKAPLVDGTVSSGFGIRMHPLLHRLAYHAGVDIAAPVGAAIYALADGVVEETGYRAGGYGMFLRLRHACDLETFYGHLSGFAVYPGEHVNQGALLGYVGNTGLSTGPHLHLEIRFRGRRVAPKCCCRPVPVHRAPGSPARVA